MRALFIVVMLMLGASAVSAESISVRINGMVCESCAQGLKETFEKMPEVENANGDVEKKILLIQTKAGMTLDDEKIKQEIIKAGYTPVSVTHEKLSTEK